MTIKPLILRLDAVDLQDFYSHSNWVELGYKEPNSNLIKANAEIHDRIAGTRINNS